MKEKPVFDTPQVAKAIRDAISTYMEACGSGQSINVCDIVMDAIDDVRDEWGVLLDDLIDEEEDDDDAP